MASVDGARASAPMLRVTTAAQAAEVAGLCVAIVLNTIDSASGNSWATSSGIAFIGFEALFAVALVAVTVGIRRVRPWSRTPAMMSQLFIALIAVWLLEAHRYAWGVPALLLAVAACVGLFTPSSFRALQRPGDTPR